MRFFTLFTFFVAAISAQAQSSWKAVNPDIQTIVNNVSTDRLEAIERKLESFETRSTISDTTSPTRGVGGDHTAFNLEGYPAVRMTVPNEDYSRQHTLEDIFEGVDLDYLTRVVRINVASAATMALAPSAPVVTDEKGQPMIGRATTRYDADLKWNASEGNPASYVVIMRKTTSPDWEREFYVGNVTQYTMKDVSIDEWVFGVRAIGQNGAESLTTAYVNPLRPKSVYKTLP